MKTAGDLMLQLRTDLIALDTEEMKTVLGISYSRSDKREDLDDFVTKIFESVQLDSFRAGMMFAASVIRTQHKLELATNDSDYAAIAERKQCTAEIEQTSAALTEIPKDV